MQAACAAMQIADLLTQLVTDTDVTMEVSSFAAVALGLTFVGTCHAASVEAMLQVSMHAPSSNLQQRTSACKFDHHGQFRRHDVFLQLKAVTCCLYALGCLSCCQGRQRHRQAVAAQHAGPWQLWFIVLRKAYRCPQNATGLRPRCV